MLMSPSQIIREAGQDPQAVWKETADDIATMIDELVARGITKEKATEMVLIAMAPGRSPLKEMPAPDPKPTDKAE